MNLHLGLLGGIVLTVVLAGTRNASVPAALPPPGPPDPNAHLKFLGSGSCAAAACHGSAGAPGALGSEHPTWLSRDKHARAHDVLFEPRSLAMMKHLGRANAHEDLQCLGCHVHPHYQNVARRAPEFFARDGVGCESCHGPGEKWVPEHYKPSWKSRSPQEKQALGMSLTRPLTGRAQVCVDCHVGSAQADVDHDLIAAGHPRLNFEFAAFHAGWTRHWPDALDKDPARGGQPDFEARAWVVGQVETSRAALRLLQVRAEREVWPEFAELDCYACHHNLQGKSWRREDAPRAGAAGKLRWSSWYHTELPRALAVTQPHEHSKVLLAYLETIRARIADGADGHEIAALASRAQLQLPADCRGPLSLPELFQALVMEDARLATRGWDEATQFYLALAAVHNAWTDQGHPPPAARLRPFLVDLRSFLRFPRDHDSPRQFDPDRLRNRLRKLQDS